MSRLVVWFLVVSPEKARMRTTHVLSDDGQSALVEFTAKDRPAFNAILADKTVKSFLKGKDKREDVEAEFKKQNKDFDFTKFGVRVP